MSRKIVIDNLRKFQVDSESRNEIAVKEDTEWPCFYFIYSEVNHYIATNLIKEIINCVNNVLLQVLSVLLE